MSLGFSIIAQQYPVDRHQGGSAASGPKPGHHWGMHHTSLSPWVRAPDKALAVLSSLQCSQFLVSKLTCIELASSIKQSEVSYLMRYLSLAQKDKTFRVLAS